MWKKGRAKKSDQEKNKLKRAKIAEKLKNSIFPAINSKMVQMIIFFNFSNRLEQEQTSLVSFIWIDNFKEYVLL